MKNEEKIVAAFGAGIILIQIVIYAEYLKYGNPFYSGFRALPQIFLGLSFMIPVLIRKQPLGKWVRLVVAFLGLVLAILSLIQRW